MTKVKSYTEFLEELNKLCVENAQFSRNLIFKTSHFGDVEIVAELKTKEVNDENEHA